MEFFLITQSKKIIYKLENFFANFSPIILMGVLLAGVYIQGFARIFGILSILGAFWGSIKLSCIFFRDKTSQIIMTIIILLVASFLPCRNISFAMHYFFAGVGLYSLFKKNVIWAFLSERSSAFYFLIFLFGLFFWGIKGSNIALMADNYHPFYEFGIGRCIEWGNWLASFLPRDMAYMGGEVRYHFLATRLPFLFSALGRVDYFSSITFLIPIFFTFLFAFVADIFRTEFSWAKEYEQRFIFLAVLAGGSFVVPSFGLGVVLSLLALLFLSRNSFGFLLLTMILLVLTKFTLFVLISSVWGVFFCWELFADKNFNVRSFAAGIITLSIAALLYLKFLSGAHAHCLWITLPWIFVNPFRPHFLTQAAPFSFGFFVFIIFQVIAGSWMFKYAYDRKQTLMSLISICFVAGLVWRYFLLSEFVEGNNFHFMTLSTITSLFVLLFFTSSLSPILQLKLHLNDCCKRLVHFFFRVVVAGKIFINFFINAFLPIKSAALFIFMGVGSVVDTRTIDAWSFLESRKDDQGALVGKHYELRGHYSHDSDLPGDRGFLASGFSGKQLFVEGYCSRGIMMNPDYAERVAHVLSFFKKFVHLSVRSQDSFKLHYDDIEYLLLPAYPLSQSPSKMIRLLHTFSLGKEWHRVNYEKKLYQDMQNHMAHLDQKTDLEYFINYFKRFNIGYLVLEDGDKPTQELLNRVVILYQNDVAMVMQFKK